MQFRQTPDYLIVSEAAAAAFAAVRLLQFRLARKFPFLLSFLATYTIFGLTLSILTRRSPAYLWVYLIAGPFEWITASLAVYEMFSLIFRDFPGLRTAGRWALYAAIGISLIAFLLVAGTSSPKGTVNSQRLYYELIVDRSIHFSLAAIVLVLILFLSRYPLHLDRNTYVASGVFGAVFLAQSAVRLIDTLSLRLVSDFADYPEVAFTALGFLGWGILLRAPKPVILPRVHTNKPREIELLHQLESLNDILSRSARR